MSTFDSNPVFDMPNENAKQRDRTAAFKSIDKHPLSVESTNEESSDFNKNDYLLNKDNNSFSREDNDLTSKLNSSWESLQTNIKESKILDNVSSTIHEGMSTLSNKASELKHRGQKKLEELQRASDDNTTVRTDTTTQQQTQELLLGQNMKWSDLLPYLLPLLILSLALISGVGVYKALFNHSNNHLLKPVLNGNSDFIDNPMQQTPFHLHDDDLALKHDHDEFNMNLNLNPKEPSLMDKMKFHTNLNLHHAKDMINDNIDNIKDGIGHVEMNIQNGFDYIKEKTSLLGDKTMSY